MSMFRLILFFVLFYVIYFVLKLFITNFRLGSKNKGGFKKDRKPESKYDNVEEAEFTEIKKKDENDKN
jgi:hypothetical protein